MTLKPIPVVIKKEVEVKKLSKHEQWLADEKKRYIDRHNSHVKETKKNA